MVALLILVITHVTLGYVRKNESDIWDLVIPEDIHQIDETEEQDLLDLNEISLPSDWGYIFDAENGAEELEENPFVFDPDYPEIILPLNDEGDFDSVNPTHIGDYDLFEGDMLLGEHLTPLDDLAILHDDSKKEDDDNPSWYRKMTIKSLFRWPEVDGVPTVYFRVHKTALENQRIIYAAIEEWSSKTCIRFQELGLSSDPKVLQQERSTYHILFIGVRGCWSVLGHQGWNRRLSRQPLSLGKGCKRLSTAIHEIGHALGLVHEQARADRDDYIQIISSNIKRRHLQNFKKAKSFVNVPYDFRSIMHYGMTYFTKNGDPTLVPLDPHKFRFLVSRSTELTFRDVLVVNSAYKCIDKWKQQHPDIECENGGYVNDIGNCICSPDASGSLCEHSTGVYYPPAKCGGNFTEPAVIQTPNYPRPFPKNSACTWWFIAPECHKVKITFKSFELLKRYRGICKWDFMELRTEDPIYPGIRYCDRDLEPGARFVSSRRDLLVNFYGKYTFKSGFEADVTFIPDTRCLNRDVTTSSARNFMFS